MVRLTRSEALAISSKGFSIQIGQVIVFQDGPILRHRIRIAQHLPNFLFRATIVPFVVSLIGPKHRVTVDIDRPIAAMHARDLDYDEFCPVYGFSPGVSLRTDRITDFLRIIEAIPERLQEPAWIGNTFNIEIICNSKNQITTISIGKSRYCFPE